VDIDVARKVMCHARAKCVGLFWSWVKGSHFHLVVKEERKWKVNWQKMYVRVLYIVKGIC